MSCSFEEVPASSVPLIASGSSVETTASCDADAATDLTGSGSGCSMISKTGPSCFSGVTSSTASSSSSSSSASSVSSPSTSASSSSGSGPSPSSSTSAASAVSSTSESARCISPSSASLLLANRESKNPVILRTIFVLRSISHRTRKKSTMHAAPKTPVIDTSHSLI